MGHESDRRFEAEEKTQELERRLVDSGRFFDLVGKSPAMTQLYRRIAEIAVVDSTVLIEGETGTGKELVARAIHLASRRNDHPFIAVNCAGFTESILGNQLPAANSQSVTAWLAWCSRPNVNGKIFGVLHRELTG